MSPVITANQLSVVKSGIITNLQDSEELKMNAYQNRLNLSNQGNEGEITEGDCKCIYYVGSSLNDRYFKIMLHYGFV